MANQKKGKMGKIIPNARFDKALRLKEGLFVHNYHELARELELMSKEEFEKYIKWDDSITNWIMDNFQDDGLVLKLGFASSKNQYVSTIKKHIAKLEKEKTPLKKVRPVLAVNIFFVMVIIIISYFFIQYVDMSEDKLEEIRELSVLRQIIREQQSTIEDMHTNIVVLKDQNYELTRKLEEKQPLDIILPLEESRPTPMDRIKLTDLVLSNNFLRINIEGILLAQFTSTGSMLPVLGSGATAIQIIPKIPEEIRPGDIISYELKTGSIIIHRVIEVGNDNEGWYAVTKGDNNPLPDREKVRFSQVQRVLIGILY